MSARGESGAGQDWLRTAHVVHCGRVDAVVDEERSDADASLLRSTMQGSDADLWRAVAAEGSVSRFEGNDERHLLGSAGLSTQRSVRPRVACTGDRKCARGQGWRAAPPRLVGSSRVRPSGEQQLGDIDVSLLRHPMERRPSSLNAGIGHLKFCTRGRAGTVRESLALPRPFREGHIQRETEARTASAACGSAPWSNRKAAAS